MESGDSMHLMSGSVEFWLWNLFSTVLILESITATRYIVPLVSLYLGIEWLLFIMSGGQNSDFIPALKLLRAIWALIYIAWDSYICYFLIQILLWDSYTIEQVKLGLFLVVPQVFFPIMFYKWNSHIINTFKDYPNYLEND